MKRVTHEEIMSRLHESFHTQMGHVTYELVVSPGHTKRHRVETYSNASCHTWKYHVSHEWIMSHMNASCCQVIETEEDRKKNPQPRWHWTELRVGEVVSVYHRDFLVMDCDAFTRDWMLKHNLEQVIYIFICIRINMNIKIYIHIMYTYIYLYIHV